LSAPGVKGSNFRRIVPVWLGVIFKVIILDQIARNNPTLTLGIISFGIESNLQLASVDDSRDCVCAIDSGSKGTISDSLLGRVLAPLLRILWLLSVSDLLNLLNKLVSDGIVEQVIEQLYLCRVSGHRGLRGIAVHSQVTFSYNDPTVPQT
jgi:hypothetical protein